MSNKIKKLLVGACEAYVETKLLTVQKAIDDLEAALKLETKCSMGDKYETGRAMLHLEFEKLSGHHEEFRKLRRTVRMIPVEKSYEAVAFGSAVKTREANYFISIPAGELTVEGHQYYAIGANAPIAKLMAGKTSGENFLLHGREIDIEEVF